MGPLNILALYLSSKYRIDIELPEWRLKLIQSLGVPVMKAILSLIMLVGFFMTNTLAKNMSSNESRFWALKNIDIKSLGKKQASKLHKEMTKILIQIEKKEKYESYGKGSKFSYRSFLNDFTDIFVNECHANDRENMCLFGGWPSYRSGGSCKTPYGSVGRGAASDLGTQSYNSEVYCQNRGLFRCNPLIFGPGLSSDLIPEEMGNVNGNGNNSAPFDAGICVDISAGFSGLSDRCASASERLDEIRQANDLPPWRESEFFNADRAANFRSLQHLILQKCQADPKRLNIDGMCIALEENLALTAAAARANNLNGIAIEEVFPQCAPNVENTGVSCEAPESASLSNLQAAIESIKGNQDCQFSEVHAWNNGDHSDALSLPECSTSIVGTLASGLSTDGDTGVTIYVKTEGAVAVPITISINPETSSSSIIEMLSANEEYGNACQSSGSSSCNVPEIYSSAGPNSSTTEFGEALNNLGAITMGGRGCGLLNVTAQLRDPSITEARIEENQPSPSVSSYCRMSMSDEVYASFNDPQYRNSPIPVVIELRRGGTVLSVPLDLDSATVDGEAITNSIRSSENYQNFCNAEASETAEVIAEREEAEKQGRENLRSSLGMEPNQFLTATQESALMGLSDIEGLSVSVSENGTLVFSHPNINEIGDRLVGAFPRFRISEDQEMGVLLADGITNATFLTRGREMIISDDELSSLGNISEYGSLEDVSRDSIGNLVLTLNSGSRLLLENDTTLRELEDRAGGEYIIEPVLDETGNPYADRRVSLRPITGERAPASTIDERAFRELRIRSDAAESLVRMRLNGDMAIEENFNITIGDPILRPDGQSEININFFMTEVSIALRNDYQRSLREEANRLNCSVEPAVPHEFDTTLSIICPPRSR